MPLLAVLLQQGMAQTDRILHAYCDTSIICPGENLVYEVSWFSAKLGQIRVTTTEPRLVNGETRYQATAYIDSYDGIPFVNLHAVDYTEMDTRFYSRRAQSFERDGDVWAAETYHYDVPDGKLVVERSRHATKRSSPLSPPTFDTLYIPEKFFEDGFSILYFARAKVRSTEPLNVPTVVYGKQGRTVFRFDHHLQLIDLDALHGKKVRTIPLEGRAQFQGLFGLTGDFKGWFSDDVAAIPVKAEMKVLVGSVKIELIEWKRSGWNPPVVEEK